MRIITTTCSNTEIVHALGFGHWLVAVDDHSDYPPTLLAQLPRVGPDLSIDVSRVIALKPDLVLASDTVPGHDKVIESLVEAGLNVFAPRTIGLADVYRDITDIAALLGAPEAGRRLIGQMQQQLRAREPRFAAGADQPVSLMVQWWPKPIIGAAQASWIHDMIELAGARNGLQHSAERSLPLADDDPALHETDAWVISWCGVQREKYRPQVLYRRNTLQHCPAVTNRNIFCISEAYLGRPSPRLIDGFRQLCAIADQLGSPRRAR